MTASPSGGRGGVLARLVLMLASAAAVVLLLSDDFRDAGPGPVTAVHARVPELDGGRACAVCHGTGEDAFAGAAGAADLARACLDCHAAIASQLDSGHGLHGGLEPARRRLCGSCHVEHLGRDVALTGARSFRLAGLAGPEGFDHGTVDWDLHGRHAELACADCHPHADAAVLEEGQARYLGVTQACTDCHDDPHAGAMQRSCEACHGQEHAFDDLTDFLHDARFPLHHAHGGLDCAACHEDGGAYAVERLSDRALVEDPRTLPWRRCADCHDSPHDPSFVAAVPAPGAPAGPSADACALCHSERHAGWTGDDIRFEAAWHAASGFGLDAPHDGLACAACHARAPGEPFDDAYPGRAADSCASCHQDAHHGQFDDRPDGGRDCLACHPRDSFAEHRFGAAAHTDTRFPLTGLHATLACEACHDAFVAGASDPEALVAHTGPARVLRGLARACEACHADVHRGAFSTLPAKGQPVDCAHCHDTHTFGTTHRPFDHAAWTGFALADGHALDCEACHASSAVPDLQGRSLGRVSALHPGDPAACAGCHADVHAGAFATPSLPARVDGRPACARCHTVRSFQELHPPGFDHGAWTGFPLAAAHAQADCAACHGAGDAPRRLGRVAEHFPGDPQRCATCHPDPHDSLFARAELPARVDGRTGCARCHDARTFRSAATGAFDHGFWTGWPLDGAHARAQCSACHAEHSTPDANGRSAARARGRDCAACHADPHAGQFARDGRQDCARCHDSGAWLLPAFDHGTTRFPLDATHARVACADCHPRQALASGGDAVRYRPLGRRCDDCHAVGRGPSGEGGR